MAIKTTEEFMKWVTSVCDDLMVKECQRLCKDLSEPPNGSWYNILRQAQNNLISQNPSLDDKNDIKFNTNH